MSLAEYKKKRSFSRTPEPEGAHPKSSKKELLFVVQKHKASHLHYDFRLELKGTLKSWAVPKGPSMDPKDKRLAMLVEDHPFDYKDFEGIIPKGNYGAGTVIIWDQGTYEPVNAAGTMTEQEKILLKEFHSGQIKIKLKGKKLKGEFILVRSDNRAENAWLLIKKNDTDASDEEIIKKDKSVVSGKTIEQVAENKKSRQWESNRSSNGKLKEENKDSDTIDPGRDYDELTGQILEGITKKKKSPMPQNLLPMLASSKDAPFDKPDWIFEVKWDGYRALAYLNKGKVELKSRNNNSFNKKFYPVYEALKEWSVKAVVDGEIVAVDENGLSVFSKLEGWETVDDGQLEYYVFDILWLNGINLMGLPLIERRKILQQLVPENDIIRFSEGFEANGKEFFASAEKLGIEGIVAKKGDSIYEPNVRTKNWLKIKTEQRHEAVIAGYTKNEGSDKEFSALILGIYDGNGELKFIGQAGTGFTKQSQVYLLKKLRPLEIKKSPFKEEPVINRSTRFRPKPPKTEVHWVKPELVCEVRYQELKPEGIMRHASYQGLKEDKTASQAKVDEVVHEPTEKKSRLAKKPSSKTSSTGRDKNSMSPKSKSISGGSSNTPPNKNSKTSSVRNAQSSSGRNTRTFSSRNSKAASARNGESTSAKKSTNGKGQVR